MKKLLLIALAAISFNAQSADKTDEKVHPTHNIVAKITGVDLFPDPDTIALPVHLYLHGTGNDYEGCWAGWPMPIGVSTTLNKEDAKTIALIAFTSGKDVHFELGRSDYGEDQPHVCVILDMWFDQ